MSLLVPLALFGWIPLTIFFFLNLKPHHAAIISVIGGTLFLPMAGYNFQGLPPFTKNTVIAIGLILGGQISGHRRAADFRWCRYDVPMLIWCLCPLASSLSNNLGWYDGLSGIWGNISLWGIPYMAGRVYIDNTDKLRDLCIAIVIGGILYLPLCLYEIRMSPQLSNMIYDFFPHTFLMHKRYGGFRPIVFMQHGLMVALWMAATTTAAFWLWRSGELKYIKGVPLSFFTLALILTTILCKSVNGWVALGLGCGGYFIFRLFMSPIPFRLLHLLVPFYILLRISGGISGGEIENFTTGILAEDRIESMSIRLVQEDLFVEKTLQRPLLGWGMIGRAWPRDEESGKRTIEMIDALWLITFSTRGYIGLFSLIVMMLVGPWLILRFIKKQKIGITFDQAGPVLLGLIVILFMIDCLMNGMLNPVYILVSGALLGWYVHKVKWKSVINNSNGQ